MESQINLKLAKLECPFCEYEWFPRTETPKRCPYCERYLIKDKEDGKK